MSSQQIKNLKRRIAGKFIQGGKEGVEIVKSNTPIDTRRLFTSTRLVEDDNTLDNIKVRIVAGGLTLPGIDREVGIDRDVDYAIFLDRKTGYFRSCTPAIMQAIKRKLNAN